MPRTRCHMGMKELFHYFKRDNQTLLPKSISQSAIDAVNRDVLKISSSQSNEAPKTQIEYIKGPSCTRDLEDSILTFTTYGFT